MLHIQKSVRNSTSTFRTLDYIALACHHCRVATRALYSTSTLIILNGWFIDQVCMNRSIWHTLLGPIDRVSSLATRVETSFTSVAVRSRIRSISYILYFKWRSYATKQGGDKETRGVEFPHPTCLFWMPTQRLRGSIGPLLEAFLPLCHNLTSSRGGC